MARKSKDNGTGLLIDPHAVVTVTAGGKVLAVEPTIPEDKLKPEVATIADEAKAIVITSHAQSESAGLFLQTVKAMRKKIAELCDPVCQAAHSAWKKTVALRESLDAPLATAETNVKRKMSDYFAEQERLRRAEEQRLQAIAEKAAREKQEQDAMLLDAIGEDEAAEAVMAAPVIVAPVRMAPVAKPVGIARTQNWKWRVTDQSKIPDEFWVLDTVKINGIVRAAKESSSIAIPGIEAYDDGGISAR